MSKVNKRTEGKNTDAKGFITLMGLILSIFSIIIALWSVIQSNENAKIDRRADTYTAAIVSLDTLCFYEWSLENGYEDVFNSEIDDQWLQEQLLDAVEIKAKLEIFDKEKAESYWNIISQIFDTGHKFDTEQYEKLKKSIMDEI